MDQSLSTNDINSLPKGSNYMQKNVKPNNDQDETVDNSMYKSAVE